MSVDKSKATPRPAPNPVIASKHAEGCRPSLEHALECARPLIESQADLKQRVKELVEAAEQARDAAAAAFRVAAQTGTWDALEAEMKKAGVREGFGKRLDSAIARVKELQ